MFNAYQKKHPKIFWLIVVLAILMPSISIGSALFVKDEYARTLVSDITSPLYNLIATIALIFAAKQTSKISKRRGLGWGVLALAQFSFTLGDILWAVLELVLKSSPFPSIADGLYLLFYPLFLVGIFILPSQRLSTTEWLKRCLDISIVMIAAILGFWIFLIGPIMGTEFTTPFLEMFLTVAYPVGDLILIFALLIILYYGSRKLIFESIWILTIGSIVMIVTDSLFGYQSSLGTYISGGILDLGWILATELIAFAGIYQAVASQTYRESDTFPYKKLLIRKRISQALVYLPYAWVAGAYYLLQKYHHEEYLIDPDKLVIGVGCIFGLVIIRQIITLNENNRLLINVRNALEQETRQASELNKTNQNLQQEIIKRERIEEQLSHDALHDGLTGLANRVLFMDRLGHAVEITKRELEFHYSVLLLNIDNFKSINDGLGHSTGDEILIEIAKRLINCTRSIDTVARIGGDEFVILLEYTMEINSTISVVNRIFTDLQHPFIHKGEEVLIRCSIGIVQGISEYNNSEEIIRDVDIALNRAKERGKARYEIFNMEMRTSALSRLEIEADLHRAISNGEFYLVYQPIYSLEQNHIEGVEALIRWRHPLRGLVMPSEFINIAEETGSIIQIGDWVMHEACTQLRKWHVEFPDLDHLSVSVNISGRQINQKDFVDKVKEILHVTGLNPKRLILEITESTFIENQSLINELLSVLRKIGVAFAIDDFGTGYSSLGYLRNFSVDTIKIDKSFVDEVVEGKKGFEIIKTIIQLAEGMGINTVAEGIENSEQLQILRSLMCKYGQGYYLSKPVDVQMIETILNHQAGLKVT